MKKKPLYLLCGVLAVLLAGYFGASALLRHSAQKKADAAAAALSICSADSLTKMSYQTADNTLAFTKSAGAWQCDSYPGWPLKQDPLNTLEQRLTSLSALRVLDDPGALAEYGLDNPECTLTLTDSAGTSRTLQLAHSDANSTWYLHLDGDDRVFTVDETLADAVNYSILDLVDYQTLPALEATSLVRVELAYAGNSYDYAQTAANGDYTWQAQKNGTAMSIDEATADTAAYDLTQIVQTACIAYDLAPENYDTYGFTSPVATLRVTYTDASGAQAQYTLTVGALYGSGDSYAVMLGDSGQVTLAAANNLDQMFTMFCSEAAS